MSFVKENDWNLFLGSFPLLLVTGSALRSVGARALLLQWRILPFLPLVGSFLGPDSPPEGFRLKVGLRVLGQMVLNVGCIRPYVLIVKGLEVPVLEEGTLGTEGLM